MIKITGNDIKRGGVKLGWIEGNDIRDHLGQKLGYFSSNDIYRANGAKVGFIDGNNLYIVNGPSIRLDDLRERHVNGGNVSDLIRAAVMILVGD